MPVSATFTTEEVVVTFDQELQPGSLATGNWAVSDGTSDFQVDSATASGMTVTLAISSPSIGPGEPGVSYAADPADVIGVNDVPAEPFDHFPFD